MNIDDIRELISIHIDYLELMRIQEQRQNQGRGFFILMN